MIDLRIAVQERILKEGATRNLVAGAGGQVNDGRMVGLPNGIDRVSAHSWGVARWSRIMYEETDKSMSTLAVYRIVQYSRVLLHAVPIAGHIRLGYMPGVASLVPYVRIYRTLTRYRIGAKGINTWAMCLGMVCSNEERKSRVSGIRHPGTASDKLKLPGRPVLIGRACTICIQFICRE